MKLLGIKGKITAFMNTPERQAIRDAVHSIFLEKKGEWEIIDKEKYLALRIVVGEVYPRENENNAFTVEPSRKEFLYSASQEEFDLYYIKNHINLYPLLCNGEKTELFFSPYKSAHDNSSFGFITQMGIVYAVVYGLVSVTIPEATLKIE